MRRILFTFLFINTLFCSAQKWCPPGAEWTYDFSSFFSYGYLKLSFEKDTIISLQSCKKINYMSVIRNYAIDPTGPISVFYGDPLFSFAKNDTVFIFWDNKFEAIYFFDAKVGDTLHFGDINCKDENYYQVVNEKGINIINNDTLRYYKVNFIVDSSNTLVLMKSTIVENFGIIENYMYPFYSCYTDPNGYYLRCYHDNKFGDYISNPFKKCENVIINTKEEISNYVNLFPNPTSQLLTINSPFNEIFKDAYIYSTSGKLISHFSNLKSESSFSIDVSNLKNGMYILQITTDDAKTITKKFIKDAAY